MKVVLDTNVLFSAFAARGLCDALVQACLESCHIVLSEHILRELQEHLTGKLKMAPAHAAAFVDLLRSEAEMVNPVEVPATACRDKDDLPVLGTAEAGKADFLVTGDRDLLALKSHRGVQIVGPREFHRRLQE